MVNEPVERFDLLSKGKSIFQYAARSNHSEEIPVITTISLPLFWYKRYPTRYGSIDFNEIMIGLIK